MAEPEVYGLSAMAAGQLKEMVELMLPILRTELGLDSARPGRRPVINQHEHRLIRVTSTTLSSGRYPAKLVAFDAVAGTFTDLADIWAVEANGGTLVAQRYMGHRWGVANGRPVFQVGPGGSSSGGGGSPVFSGAHVYSDGGFTIPTGFGDTAIEWDTELYDTDDYWDAGDPELFTIPSDGVYHFGAMYYYVDPGASNLWYKLKLSSTNLGIFAIDERSNELGSGFAGPTLHTSRTVLLEEGEVCGALANHSDSDGIAITGTSASLLINGMWIHKVGELP